jgi:hypothetical protein
MSLAVTLSLLAFAVLKKISVSKTSTAAIHVYATNFTICFAYIIAVSIEERKEWW